MDQPSIHLFGFLFYEPVTSFTNLILSACCLIFGFKVGKSHARYWSWFFYCLSFATFFGALGHGLMSDKNNILHLISRTGNMIALYISSIASIVYLKNKNLKLFLYTIALIQLVIALTMIITINRFWIVEWNAIIGLALFVAGINGYLFLKGFTGSRDILTGIVINSLTAIIFSNKISISKWFNHNDISHVIFFIGFYFMARGAQKFQNYASN